MGVDDDHDDDDVGGDDEPVHTHAHTHIIYYSGIKLNNMCVEYVRSV